MATFDPTTLVRTEFLSRENRQLLQSPPDALLGVSPDAVSRLRELQIRTVFDLACSRVFGAARQLTSSADGQSDMLRFGAAPADAVHPDALVGRRIDELQFQPITVLADIGDSNAAALSAALAVKTVRDLALWPPYQAARRILDNVLNPDQEDGVSAEAPGELIPTANRFPTERVIYNANFLIEVEADAHQPLTEVDKAGPIALTGKPNLLTTPATGAMLTFSQNWYPLGLSLGQLLYCLPLAPGESTKLALIDWRRRTATSLDEDVSQTEALSNTLTQNRAISEVVNSVATEVQSGTSKVDSSASSGSIGGGAAGLVGPGLAGGTASASTNASTTSGVFTSKGRRAIAASMQQQISDSTHQQSFASRNRHASTVSEAVAEERESISTRTVTNYNHMHALTVQYYEVVQIYRTELRTEQARRLLFIPFQPLDFANESVILRYRSALIAGAQDPYVRDLLVQATGVVSVSLDLPRFAPVKLDPDDSKKDQLKAAKEAAKQRQKDRAKLHIAFNRAKLAGGVLAVNDTDITSWDMPGDLSLIDVGWDTDPDRVSSIRVRLESGSQIDVTENGFGRGGTVVNGDLQTPTPLRQIEAVFAEFTSADAPEVQKITLKFLARSQVVHVPCDCALPAGRESARLLRIATPVPLVELAEILNEQALFYSQIVWMNTDPNELIMQMGNLAYKGRRVVDFIEPRPVAVLGNALGFIWNDENDRVWQEWKTEHASAPPRHDLVPLPTDGVFAEAVLGRFNSAEKLDLSRFWNWQDSPIPIQPPDIAAIQAGQHEGVTPAPAGNLEAPVINIMNPRELPAPTGLAAAVNAVTAANMFRDMSGAAQLAALNQAALLSAAAGATGAGAQAGANMATFAQFAVDAAKVAAGFALGVPVPGGTNITNAGAVANEAGKIDIANIASGGSGTGGSSVATGGGGGQGGAGGSATGGSAVGTGGSATSNASGSGVANANANANARGSNREDVVRRTAGLPPKPTPTPSDRPVKFRFQFFDVEGTPLSGKIDIRISPDFGPEIPFARFDDENETRADGSVEQEALIRAGVNGGHCNVALRVPSDDGSVKFDLAGASDFRISPDNVVSFTVEIASDPVEVTATAASDGRTKVIDEDRDTLDLAGELTESLTEVAGEDGVIDIKDLIKLGENASITAAQALKASIGYSHAHVKSTETDTGGSSSEQQKFVVKRMRFGLTVRQVER